MSQAQIDATALYCWLLEFEKPKITGVRLFEKERATAAAHLLREQLLIRTESVEWLLCPDCGEMARVLPQVTEGNITLNCPECDEVEAPVHSREIYQASLPKLVNSLLNGLNLSLQGMKPIVPDRVWHLGTTEEKRGQLTTWYFARSLSELSIAQRLREHIGLEKTTQSCVILTSSQVPLPMGSPLAGFDVRPLFSMGRVGQSRFEFFGDRLSMPARQIIEEAAFNTTLRYVETEAKVMMDGKTFSLDPSQRALLLALIQAIDHELGKDTLKAACGSQAQRFSPIKCFDRNENTQSVYHRFISYLKDDQLYALSIPEEDSDWLF
jgi:hypothetical protein